MDNTLTSVISRPQTAAILLQKGGTNQVSANPAGAASTAMIKNAWYLRSVLTDKPHPAA